MTLLVVRMLKGAYVPSSPEDENSLLKPVSAGLVALIPDGFELPKGTFEVIQKVNVKKNK